MKKFLIFASIFFGILIIISPLITYSYVKYEMFTLEKQTYEYLVKKGYKETDIKSIKCVLQKMPGYVAHVIFVDEPDITYYYRRDGQEIIQIDVTPKNKEHLRYKHIENREWLEMQK